MLLLPYHRFGVSFGLTSAFLTTKINFFYDYKNNCQSSVINHGVLLISIGNNEYITLFYRTFCPR